MERELMSEPIEARPKGKGWVWIPEELCWVRLRKLTPTECFRLMGVSAAHIGKIIKSVFRKGKDVPYKYDGLPDKEQKDSVISNSQQYKMAGNSIVVDVLAGIFTNLFINPEEQIKDTLF